MSQQQDNLKALIRELKNNLNGIGQIEQRLIELLKKNNPDMKFDDLSKKNESHKRK
jgi:hypothetical protein